MRITTLLVGILLLLSKEANAQSLELMPGHEGVFADVQWLKYMGERQDWSIFSRTRGRVDYHGQTDLFTGAYLNYTTTVGIGGSIVGRLSGSGAGVDGGIHYFRTGKGVTFFGLISFGMKMPLQYSWFSILRYDPVLKGEWKFYGSIELFSFFFKSSHVASVQRMRLGVGVKGYQFGVAANLNTFSGSRVQDNLGAFVRKAF